MNHYSVRGINSSGGIYIYSKRLKLEEAHLIKDKVSFERPNHSFSIYDDRYNMLIDNTRKTAAEIKEEKRLAFEAHRKFDKYYNIHYGKRTN